MRGFAVRVSAVNHVCGSGNVVRWPQGLSCTLFVSQEQSRDWSQNQLTRAAVSVPFQGIYIVSYRGWYELGRHGDETPRTRAKCTEMQRVSNHAESSLSAWFTYVVQNRTTVLVPKRGPVQRVSR